MSKDISISVSDDNAIITVFIPVSFKRHGGKKVIISPQGVPVNSDRDKNKDWTLLKNLVAAHRYQRMIYTQKYPSISELCVGEDISKGHIVTVMRLVTLAPDIQESILNNTYPPHLSRADFVKPFPLIWEDQRKYFGFSRQSQ